MVKNKRCNGCEKQKPFSMFDKHSTGKYGLNSHCKECRKNYSQKYYQIHRIKILKCCKKYRETHKTKAANYLKKYQKTIKGCLYICFRGMQHRCNNPKHISYRYYGGREIKCLFENANEFIDYVINELRIDPRGLTIDRIDNNGHYEKGNIRFVTIAENNRNKRKRND